MRRWIHFRTISRLCGIVALVALGDTHASAQAPFFTSGAPDVVPGAGATLGVALPVSNSGTATAASVEITSIRLANAPPATPSVFPASIGDVKAGNTFLIIASFNGSPLAAGAHYLLTVRGTYLSGNTKLGFTVNRFLTIPGPPHFFLGINKTDQLLLEAQAATGETVDYFGPKDTNGLATGLDTVLVQTSSGDQFRYDVDSQGRPVLVLNADGTTFKMQWSSTTSVLLTATSADGAKNLVVPIDLSNQNLGQFAFSHRQSPTSTGLGARKQMPSASFSGNLALSEVSERVQISRSPYREYCTLTSTISMGRSMTAAQAGINSGICGTDACVTVNHCGGPADDASVSVTYVGSIVRTLPGKPIGSGTGTYDVRLPSPGLGAEIANIEQGCENGAEFLKNTCIAANILGGICAVLTLNVEDPAAAYFGIRCLTFLERIIIACDINGGQLPEGEGTPDINGAFCSFVDGAINLANELANSVSVTLLPTATLSGFGTVHGRPTVTTAGCSAQGNCPTMPVTLSCTQTYNLIAAFDDGSTVSGRFTVDPATLNLTGTPIFTANLNCNLPPPLPSCSQSPVSTNFVIGSVQGPGFQSLQGRTFTPIINEQWWLFLGVPNSSLMSPTGGPICLAANSVCGDSLIYLVNVSAEGVVLSTAKATSGTVTPVGTQ
jgi:hypothetical protein